MDLQKINVKLFSRERSPVRLAEFIDIFHRWIQASEGRCHDVADYSHMHAGPGIVLIAYDENVSIDETEGRRGLLYNRKKPLTGSAQEKLRSVVRAALESCRRLEEEPALAGRLSFFANEVLVVVNDRLACPNDEQTVARMMPEIEALANLLYRGTPVEFARDPEPRKRFNVTMKAAGDFDIATLLSNLQGDSGASP